jgi:hypothetical protein
MNQRDMLARGAKGEQIVAEILKDLSPSLGYTYVNDILLDFNGRTSQIDHVLIDRYGILVIETKMSAALLKGTSTDHDWTACYASGKTHPMFNPLMQNEGHRKWLHKVLTQNGRDLPANYVQSLIVFADGKIDALELSDTDKMRVVSKSGLADFVRARYDFQPNVGQLGPEAQQDLCEFIVASNRRDDPVIWAKHLESCEKAKAGRSGPPKSRPANPRPANVIPLRPGQPRGARRPYYGKRKKRDELTPRQALVMGLVIVLFFGFSGLKSCVSAATQVSAQGSQTSTQRSAFP